jgi:membrane protease YdiL (CAAX protease family)
MHLCWTTHEIRIRTRRLEIVTSDQAGRHHGVTRGRKEQLVELLVVLFLVTPSLVFSFFAKAEAGMSFSLTAWAVILRDLALASLVFFFLWRNGEAPDRIGWNFGRGWTDVLLGIALFVPFGMLIGFLESVLQGAGLSAPPQQLPTFLAARDTPQFILAAILVTVVAFSEEIIFRGYLITRLSAVTGSTALAVFLSAVIFSLGHGYEGATGVISVGTMGLLLALAYVWRGSLVIPIVIHFLQDFSGIVLGPLLGHS